MTISHSILHRMTNVSDKSYKLKTHISCSIIFFPPGNRTFIRKCGGKNMLETDRPHITIYRYDAFALHAGLTKPTDTHSEYAILIVYPRK